VRWNDLVDTRTTPELERLSLLEEIFDPFSIRNLERLGVKPGWRCLEIGAGAGSIAHWLGDMAGPGNVVATDLSTTYLGSLRERGMTVLSHDVTVDDAPGEFDLIHNRLVLDHLPARDEAIRRMASWLAPNGWLLVEVASAAPEMSSHPSVRKAMEALALVFSRTIGTHPTWARTLPLPLRDAGLVDCGAEGLIVPTTGGSAIARWLTATHKLIEAPAIESGVITREELDEAYAVYESPSFVDYAWITVAAWGRRRNEPPR
jgi:SAM-dependent methyltransferase